MSSALRCALVVVFVLQAEIAFGQSKKSFWDFLPTTKKTVKKDSNVRKASWTDKMKLPGFSKPTRARKPKKASPIAKFNRNLNRQTQLVVSKTKQALTPWKKSDDRLASKPQPKWSGQKTAKKSGNPLAKLFKPKPQEPEGPATINEWISQERPGFD